MQAGLQAAGATCRRGTVGVPPGDESRGGPDLLPRPKEREQAGSLFSTTFTHNAAPTFGLHMDELESGYAFSSRPDVEGAPSGGSEPQCVDSV